MILLAFHPKPKGYPTRFNTNINTTKANGNKKNSVLFKNGKAMGKEKFCETKRHMIPLQYI